MAPVLNSAEELKIMREAGRIVAIAHEEMRRAIEPGVSTKALDDIANAVLRDHGASPCFLGYAPGNHPPFPAPITASVNKELVHGMDIKTVAAGFSRHSRLLPARSFRMPPRVIPSPLRFGLGPRPPYASLSECPPPIQTR